MEPLLKYKEHRKNILGISVITCSYKNEQNIYSNLYFCRSEIDVKVLRYTLDLLLFLYEIK